MAKEKAENTEKNHGRGFASMSAEKKREIASKGGKRAHELGVAYKWNSETAAIAGKRGGQISRRKSKWINEGKASQ